MFTIIQFSPTGNSAHISELLKETLKLNSPVLALEHTDPRTLKKDNALILIYPIHAFNAPRTVKRFVKNLPEGLFDSVNLISVGCNTTWINDAASKYIKKILTSKGYEIHVDEVMAMPLTLVKAFPESMIKDQLKEAASQINAIGIDILNKKKTDRDLALKSHIINFFGRGESFAARLWGLELHAKKSCIKCGKCVKECPEGNIRMKNDKIKFGFKCSMCIRCVYNCPTKSITPRISKFIPLKDGYSVDKHL